MNKGKLVVIDGVDGSGKTTQIDLLSNYLTKQNIPFEIIDFPRYEDNIYGNLIRRYLDGEFGNIHQVNPYLMALAFAGDRFLAKPLIESWLNEEKIVLANRYVSASKAHLSANLSQDQREEFMRWIDKLEYEINSLSKEDLTILLQIDSSIGQKNALSKHTPDLHESNLTHLDQAQKIYLELSKAEENWKVIDCMDNGKMKSKEQIQKEVVEILRKLFTN